MLEYFFSKAFLYAVQRSLVLGVHPDGDLHRLAVVRLPVLRQLLQLLAVVRPAWILPKSTSSPPLPLSRTGRSATPPRDCTRPAQAPPAVIAERRRKRPRLNLRCSSILISSWARGRASRVGNATQRENLVPYAKAYNPGSGIRQTPLLPFTTPLVLPIILLMTQYRLSSRGGSRVLSGAGMIAAGRTRGGSQRCRVS